MEFDQTQAFESDLHAMSHVIKMAAEGSQYHLDAINYWEAKNFAFVVN